MQRVGNLNSGPLNRLSEIDWRRSNAKMWEGRATIEGRLRKGRRNVTLTSNAIKRALGIELTEKERAIEEEFQANRLPL